MKLFRTITLVGACLAFAGSSFAQTTTPTKPATPATKPAAPAKPKVTTVEVKDLPAAVTDAIKAAYPKGTITKATSTGAGADLVYSVTVKVGAKSAAHKYTADGKPVAPVKK